MPAGRLARLGATPDFHHGLLAGTSAKHGRKLGGSSACAAAVRQCHGHRMRGTVLLLDSDNSLLVDVDLLRANGLTVYHSHEPAQALKQFQRMAPDVVVVLAAHDSVSIVSDVRDLADPATSIIVVSVPAQREAARTTGADSFLLNSALPADLLYEIHRALILRRSGRRLPWTR